jgi:hypothetical protein
MVIAVSGIVTGIGAIWTAMVARRQAQVSERQARLTERSLTEQNERARLTLEVDLLHRMLDRFNGPLYLRWRRAARYLLDNAFVDDDIAGVKRLNEAAFGVCDFFEGLAHLQRIDALSAKSVWNVFCYDVRAWWSLCKPGIEETREAYKDPALYEEFEQLDRLMADLDRERGIPALTPEQLRQFLEGEAVRGEEPPTALR